MGGDAPLREQSRRALLVKLATSGAAAGVGAALPDRWTKPVVESVVVPLHAQTSPGLIDPAALAGPWSGSWVDQVAPGPTPGSGSATMVVTVDTAARTFAVALDLDGPVLGGADPDTQVFTGTYVETGATICCQVVGRFGVPAIQITATGALTGTLAPLPEFGSVQVTGAVTATTAIIHYAATVGLSEQEYAGTLTLTKA